MAEHPELPYLAAGTVAVIGATVRDGKLPDITVPAIGTVVLVLIASATADSRIAPLVRAFGYLLLLTATITAVNATMRKAESKKKATKK